MSTAPTAQIDDAAERDRALRPTESCVVQAPAGSGKTELLTQRYLALLPTVDEPEQVLAITFTRKATAEMRARVLGALERATQPAPADLDEHGVRGRQLALAVLEHSANRGWRLLEQPQRLNLQTIDALALSIAYQTPLLSRLGGQLTPIDDATPLYIEAARRTLSYLGDSSRAELRDALQTMLRLREANLGDCEGLLARMLARREQWLLLLPEAVLSEASHEALRAVLEEPFRREHTTLFEELRQAFLPHREIFRELIELAAVACDNGQEQFSVLRGVREVNALHSHELWYCFSSLLLSQNDEWRKRTAEVGLPVKTHREESERLRAHIAELGKSPSLHALLCRLRNLPPAGYTESEWQTVRSIFIVLRQAAAELRVLFAEHEVIDFAEASLGAHDALHDPAVLMRLDTRVRHLLVDEFQDTSRPQFGLLRQLLEDWQPGDGRTVFLVGDPMQSIYLFRDAESRLFQQVRRKGIEIAGAHQRLTDLQLSTNFRSTPAMVRELNELFSRVLVASNDDDVLYAQASSPHEGNADERAMHMHVRTFVKDAIDRNALDAAEADEVVDVIRTHLPAIAEAEREGRKYRVAVLARSRPHLVQILDRLRRAEIPFRGVKLDLLRDRQEILDLLSLLRAILHPADAVAWLAVLRAPWCGLTLPALHALHGDLERPERDQSMAALLRERVHLLSAEDQQRTLHVLSTLEAAATAYLSGSLAASPASLALWLERTWQALGAPRYLGPEDHANTEAFFRMMAEMPPHSLGTLEESFNRRLDNLYAEPDPDASDDCGVQVMTIHSAKGLEFEVVLVPALNKAGKPDEQALFQWLVREQDDSQQEELLLAPIGAKIGDKPGLYRWVSRMVTRRQREEEKRLLYVACSRAIRELHLFAAIERKVTGELCKPTDATLLKAGGGGLDEHVQRAIDAPSHTSPARVVVMPAATNGSSANSGMVTSIAAASPRQVLRRLPIAAIPHREPATASAPEYAPAPVFAGAATGVRRARVQGVVLHALLERAAEGGSGARPDWERMARILLRQHGLASSDEAEALRVVLTGVRQALADPQGQWLLDARHRSWNEMNWTAFGQDAERLLRQRPDRVFVAGPAPGEPGSDHLWIVDYKTGAPDEGEGFAAFIASAREQYREQMDKYSALLREALGNEEAVTRLKHRLALYHPLLPALDWWAGE